MATLMKGVLIVIAATHVAATMPDFGGHGVTKKSKEPPVTHSEAISSSSPPEALAIGSALHLPKKLPLDKFGLPDMSGLAKLDVPLVEPKPPPLTNRVSMVRREAEPTRISDVAGATPRNSLNGHLSMGQTEERQETHRHKFPFRDDPKYTPEAIYANQNLAPDIQEFLGHLAQRARVRRKEYVKSSNIQAGLVENQGRVYEPGEDDDDKDDVEDMKAKAASGPKATPLSNFFEILDSKTNAGSWSADECSAILKNVTAKYVKMKGRSHTTWDTSGPAADMGRSEVHTGMFFKHWKVGTIQEAARKLRLSVLSFLATQDAARVKLHIWTDLDSRNSSLREILGPIALHPELMDAISITQFDPALEFSKVPPTLARETLTERFKKDEMPHLRPDLIRSVILYNYGGMWMDADTVLMQDVAPLLGEDWAYLVRGKNGVIEGALLSAKKPASRFASTYLMNYVMRQQPLSFETAVEKPLLVEIFQNDPAHTSLHVLPPCFMDSDRGESVEGVVLAETGSHGSDFFSKAVAESYRAYFSVGIKEALQDTSSSEVSVLQDPAFQSFLKTEEETDDDDEKKKAAPSSPSFAYHFRGNFGAPWAKGSLADVAERTFMKNLNIRGKPQ